MRKGAVLFACFAANLLQCTELRRSFRQLSGCPGVLKLAGFISHRMLCVLLGFDSRSLTQIGGVGGCIRQYRDLVGLNLEKTTRHVKHVFLTALLTQFDRAWFQFRQKRSVTRVYTQITQATCCGDEFDQAGEDLLLGAHDRNEQS